MTEQTSGAAKMRFLLLLVRADRAAWRRPAAKSLKPKLHELILDSVQGIFLKTSFSLLLSESAFDKKGALDLENNLKISASSRMKGSTLSRASWEPHGYISSSFRKPLIENKVDRRSGKSGFASAASPYACLRRWQSDSSSPTAMQEGICS
jgi:hypothetical protein